MKLNSNKPGSIPYNMIKLKHILNEIGEGSRPFAWKRVGATKVATWMSDIANADVSYGQGRWEQLPPLMYEFKSDKATYKARIAGGWSRNIQFNFTGKPLPEAPKFKLIIVVSFDVDGMDNTPITNFGEQFQVITTVTDIIDAAVKEILEIKWLGLIEIRIMPKLEDEEEGKPITQSKRGRLYLAYIKKQGNRLPGDWKAEIDNEMFILKPGKVSGTQTDKFISI